MTSQDDEIDNDQLVLGDLLNHVLDKGVVISGTVTISVADIDLLLVDLRVLLTSVETVDTPRHRPKRSRVGADREPTMKTHLYCVLPQDERIELPTA